MYCHKCGTKNDESSKFCIKCGLSFTDANASVTNTESQPKKSSKGLFNGIIGFLIFLVTMGVVRYLTTEGINKVSTEYQKNKTESRVEDYFTNTETWKDFNSVGSKFAAKFPSYPTHETDSSDVAGINIKYDQYSSEEVNGTTYLVSVATYNSDVDTSNPETNLEGSVNGIVASNPKNSLVSSEFTYSNGYRAVDYLILHDNIYYFKGRNILADQTLYSLMVAYESKNYSADDYSKFIDTFKINK